MSKSKRIEKPFTNQFGQDKAEAQPFRLAFAAESVPRAIADARPTTLAAAVKLADQHARNTEYTGAARIMRGRGDNLMRWYGVLGLSYTRGERTSEVAA